MFKIYQKYIASRFVFPFSLGVFFLSIFLLTFELFKIIALIVTKGVSLKLAFELIVYMSLSFLPFVVPLSSLFASLYVFGKMSDDSEIIALQSFGVTKKSLFSSLVPIALGVSFSFFALNWRIIPFSKKEVKLSIVRLASKEMISDIRPENFFTDIPQVLLFAKNVSGEGNQLEEVFIQFKDIKDNEEKYIFAKKGVLIKQKVDIADEIPGVRLHLSDGNILSTKNGEVKKILFAKYDFPILSKEQSSNFLTRNEMKSIPFLWDEMKSEKKVLQGLSLEHPRYLFHKIEIEQRKFELYSRFFLPFQSFIFIFLGGILGVRKARGHSKGIALPGILVTFLFYVLYFSGASFIKKGLVLSEIGIIIPSLTMLALTIFFYKKLDWNS